MKVLSEMSTGMGSKWILAKFSNDFYGYGTEMDFKSAWGLPVNQCGTKEDVLENCLRMIEVNKEYIQKYQKELAKEKRKPEGWKRLIYCEQKELEMHKEFARILKGRLIEMNENMESKIIKYGMRKIGTKRVLTLDGMTIEYENRWYNIYVDRNKVTVEEV